MRTVSCSLVSFLLVFIVPIAKAQPVLAPGDVMQFLSADNCATAEDGGGLFGIRTETRCSAVTGSVGAEIDVGAFNDFGKISARSALWVEFDVSATPETMGNLVPAWLNYKIFWNGLLQQADIISSSSVEVSYEIINRTTGQLVKSDLIWARAADGFKVKVGGKIPVQISRNVDEGSVGDFAAITLTRGDRFRFLIRLTCSATLFGETGGTTCDYFDEAKGYGAGLSSLQVKLGLDDKEILEIVETLKEHDHDYLTGRGVGHNNTEATTSPPNFNDDIQPPESNSLEKTSEVTGSTQPSTPPASDTGDGQSQGGNALGLISLIWLGWIGASTRLRRRSVVQV